MPSYLTSTRVVVLLALAGVASLEAAGNNIRLIDAVKQGNRASVRALIAAHADVNGAEADGMTALHYAVQSQDIAMARLLIGAGADVKATSRYGITPIYLAAQNGNATLTTA